VRTSGLFVALAMTALPAVGRADAGDAEALFRAGREAMKAEDYARACALFAESQALEPGAGTSLNLGECNEHLGKVASAWAAYADAAQRMPPSDDRREYVLGKVRELEPQVPHVRFAVDARGLRCTLSRGGVTIGPGGWGVALPTDPGEQRAELACDGRRTRTASFVVALGDTREVALAPGEPLSAAPKPEPFEPIEPNDDDGGGSALAIVGWTAAGFAAISLGIGVATGVLAIDRRDEMEAVCTDDVPPACPPEGLDAASEGSTFATTSTVTFVAGAGLAALATTLLAIHYAGDAETAIVVAPTGLGIHGSF
jgi:hypothetical protein